MRRFLSVFKRELQNYFQTPSIYVMIAIFFVLTGYFFFSTILYFSELSGAAYQYMQYGQTPALNINQIVIGNIFGNAAVIMLFVFPMLTMRLFAEEKKSGTIELLYTYPVKDWEIIIGKFASVLFVTIIILIISFVSILITDYLYFTTSPQYSANFFTYLFKHFPAVIDIGVILSGYLGLILLASAYISIGMFASSITENQIVAAVLTFGGLLLFYVIGFLGEFQGGTLEQFLKEVSFANHFQDFSNGVIDLKNITYFLIFSIFFQFITARTLESKRWRG